MPVHNDFIGAVRPLEHRILMARIGAAHFPGGQIDDTDPCRHKHIRVISFTEQIIHLVKDLARGRAGLRQASDRRLAPHHKQGRRYSLARYIRYDNRQPVHTHEKEIVKIPADFPGRFGQGKHVDLPDLREHEILRKGGQLDRARHFQFFLISVFSLRDISLQRIDRFIDVIGQTGKFQGAAHVDHFIQISFGDFCQGVVHLIQVFHHDDLHQQVDHRVHN